VRRSMATQRRGSFGSWTISTVRESFDRMYDMGGDINQRDCHSPKRRDYGSYAHANAPKPTRTMAEIKSSVSMGARLAPFLKSRGARNSTTSASRTAPDEPSLPGR
jgi:hypothetical protein